MCSTSDSGIDGYRLLTSTVTSIALSGTVESSRMSGNAVEVVGIRLS